MILEIMNPGMEMTLATIMEVTRNDDGTDVHDLALGMLAAQFPESQRWYARTYTLRFVSIYSNEWDEPIGGGSDPWYWWNNSSGENLVDVLMRQILSKPYHFIIPLVSINTSEEGMGRLVEDSNVPHWVLVTGMSAIWDYNRPYSLRNWIRVNNPFSNRTEYYPWGLFAESMEGAALGTNTGHNMVELWPLSP